MKHLPRQIHDLNDLYYFALVVKHRGFAPAQRATGVPKSKLSRRVAALEERLGLRLLQRSTRRFSVTPLGQRFFEHCQAMLVEAEAAQAVVEEQQQAPRGTVRISCPVDLLQNQIGESLLGYMQRFPEVDLQVEATNRPVDLVAEGFDVALRVRFPPLQDSGLVLRVLAEHCGHLVASPALFANQALPTRLQDCAGWPSLARHTASGEHHWVQWQNGQEVARVPHLPRLVTDNMLTLRQAAVAGLGIVELPGLMVAEDLAQGRLIKLLPDLSDRYSIIHLVYPSRRGQLPAVRALIDHLADYFKEHAAAHDE